MKKHLLTLLMAGFATVAHAQPTQAPAPTATSNAAPAPTNAPIDADPAMWVVRDDDTTIYLFGTFHMLDGRRDWFNDEVRTAFDASQQLVLEVDLPEDPAQLQAQLGPVIARLAVDPQGRAITSRLTPEQVTQLRAQLGPAVTIFDQAKFEPWMVSLGLTQAAAARMGLDPSHGPEAILRRAANERRMSFAALETAEQQFSIFDGQPDADQMEGLVEQLAAPDKMRETMEPMLAAWTVGDVDRLTGILNEGVRDDPESYRLLFTDRNRNWARWIQQRLQQPGTVFMAVGAGHLGGQGSVQDQLRALNISSARVPSR